MDKNIEKKEVKTCENCNAACCRYVAIEIDCPESIEDFENIKWYVIHEAIKVFVDEDHEWHIEFTTPCKYLREDNKCSVHEKFNSNPEIKRPDICRNFSSEICPFHNDYSEKYVFETIGDVDNYIEEVFNKGEHVMPDSDYEDDEEEGEKNED